MVTLYKIPLSYEELLNLEIDDILRLAREPREVEDYSPIKDIVKLDTLVREKNVNLHTKQKKLPVLQNFSDYNVDFSQAPKYTKLCIWQLCQGADTKERDNALLHIADDERKKGMPPEVTFGKISGVRDLMHRNNPEKAAIDPVTDANLDRIVQQTYNGNYDFGCNSSLLDRLCRKECYLAHVKFEETKADFDTVNNAYKKSKTFFKNYYENLIYTGIKTIDDNIPLMLTTFNTIVGTPGVGKSSLVSNILKNAAKRGLPTLFHAMDMANPMNIQRLGTIFLSDNKNVISSQEFMEAMSDENSPIVKQFDEVFASLPEHIKISDKRGLTVDDIRKELEIQEAITGIKFKLLIIDYIQLIASKKEGHESHASNAEQLTQLAKEKNICIIGLSQASQFEDKRMGLFSAKGSKGFEEQATVQMNCFRPFKDDEEFVDNIMSIKILKNRLGSTDTIHLKFDGASGLITDLTPDELFNVKSEMREMLSRKVRKF